MTNMINLTTIWIVYITAVVLTIIGKLIRIKYTTNDSWKKVVLNFFFLDTTSTTTTFTVLGVYFVLCHWYTQQDVIPVHWSWAFLLGTLGELIAPPLTNKIVNLVVTSVGSTVGKTEKAEEKR